MWTARRSRIIVHRRKAGRRVAAISTHPQAAVQGVAYGSLADYAMDGWKNDLRPDLNNEVPTYEGNPSFWQNVTTYTLGFGVEGTLSYPNACRRSSTDRSPWPGE